MDQFFQGFQKDTIHGFLGYISDNIPNFNARKLALLFDYMKSVGATSEEEMYKMDEEDLGNLVGAKEAKLIIQYGKVTREAANRKRSTNSTEVSDHAEEQSGGQCRGTSASSASGGQEHTIERNNGQQARMCEMCQKVPENEGQMDGALITVLNRTFDIVTFNMKESAKHMSDMMKNQAEMQEAVVKTVQEQAIAAEQRQKESWDETRKWMQSMQDMNRETILEIAQQVNRVMKLNEEEAELRRERMEKEKKKCSLQ